MAISFLGSGEVSVLHLRPPLFQSAQRPAAIVPQGVRASDLVAAPTWRCGRPSFLMSARPMSVRSVHRILDGFQVAFISMSRALVIAGLVTACGCGDAPGAGSIDMARAKEAASAAFPIREPRPRPRPGRRSHAPPSRFPGPAAEGQLPRPRHPMPPNLSRPDGRPPDASEMSFPT